MGHFAVDRLRDVGERGVAAWVVDFVTTRLVVVPLVAERLIAGLAGDSVVDAAAIVFVADFVADVVAGAEVRLAVDVVAGFTKDLPADFRTGLAAVLLATGRVGFSS